MRFDYYITESPFDKAIEICDAEGELWGRLHGQTLREIFIQGALTLKKSVYDNEAEQGLCGNLEQATYSKGE